MHNLLYLFIYLFFVVVVVVNQTNFLDVTHLYSLSPLTIDKQLFSFIFPFGTNQNIIESFQYEQDFEKCHFLNDLSWSHLINQKLFLTQDEPFFILYETLPLWINQLKFILEEICQNKLPSFFP